MLMCARARFSHLPSVICDQKKERERERKPFSRLTNSLVLVERCSDQTTNELFMNVNETEPDTEVLVPFVLDEASIRV